MDFTICILFDRGTAGFVKFLVHWLAFSSLCFFFLTIMIIIFTLSLHIGISFFLFNVLSKIYIFLGRREISKQETILWAIQTKMKIVWYHLKELSHKSPPRGMHEIHAHSTVKCTVGRTFWAWQQQQSFYSKFNFWDLARDRTRNPPLEGSTSRINTSHTLLSYVVMYVFATYLKIWVKFSYFVREN